ncbi:MAG: TadE family protein [Actinomycetota bacterium]
MIETALVTPIFLALVLMIMEVGFRLRNDIIAANASAAAMRALTVAGSSPEADYLALRSLEHGLSTISLEDVERVVVYRASGPGDQVPAACLSVPIPTGLDCNGYTAPDFYLAYANAVGTPTGHWGCGVTARDDRWCPTTRQSSLSDPGGPDHIGIYVRLSRGTLTGAIGGAQIIEVDRIARIEPQSN